MSHTLSTRTRRRTRATVVLIALLAIGTATAAGAHPDVAKWWQYDTLTWRHSWRDFPRYRRADWTWERRHRYATPRESRAERLRSRYRYRAAHFHGAISWQDGEATWYDGDGKTGACGRTLTGLYAASRTLPCGALVSVRAGGRYVLVRILDRGPFGDSRRIIDLSPSAFGRLAPLGAGVISVRTVQLRAR